MKKILLYLIDIYQKMPFTSHRSCKFVPTCSQYAKDSINIHGSLKGSYYSIIRIIKCSPLTKGGFDPVKGDDKIEKD